MWNGVASTGAQSVAPGTLHQHCIISVCAGTDQERQLHAYVNGALDAGPGDGAAVLAFVGERVDVERGRRMRQTWERVGRPA